jgi:hypothetical protein
MKLYEKKIRARATAKINVLHHWAIEMRNGVNVQGGLSIRERGSL